MTTVEYSFGGDRFDLKVSGHCSHDVCVSVSALTSALVQFAEETDRESDTVNLNVRYERGLTELHIELKSWSELARFKAGASGIITGFKLFAANFPEDVRYVDTKEKRKQL